MKENDGGPFKTKARIALHDNKDKDGHNLKTHSSQFPPTGVRIVASIATLMKRPVAKIEFTRAFFKQVMLSAMFMQYHSVNLEIGTIAGCSSHLLKA